MKRLLLAVTLILIIGVAMSLHDIDKDTSSRITPILNSADDVVQRMAQGTDGIQNTNDLEETDGLQLRERQIIAVQDGENKAIMGFYGAANKFGLKVAEDGVDVLTADDDELIFNSEQNVFKIVKSGDATLTVTDPLGGGSKSTVTIPHGLSFAPAYLVYANIPSDSSFFNDGQLTQLPVPLLGNLGAGVASGGALIWLYVSARVDTTNLYIDVLNPTSGNQTGFGNPWTFKYYILQETAS